MCRNIVKLKWVTREYGTENLGLTTLKDGGENLS